MEMKEYKVEVTHVKKEYASKVIKANSKEEAISIARKTSWEDFDETEKIQAQEWTANSNKSFYKLLVSFFRG